MKPDSRVTNQLVRQTFRGQLFSTLK